MELVDLRGIQGKRELLILLLIVSLGKLYDTDAS